MSAGEVKLKARISGMSCVHCEKAVEEALRTLAGVVQVRVSYEQGVAEFVVEGSPPSAEQMQEALSRRGLYRVEKVEQA